VTAAQNTPTTPSLRAFAAGHAAHLAVPSIEPLYLRAVSAPKRAAKKGKGRHEQERGRARRAEG